MRLTLVFLGLVAALALLTASPAVAGSCSATQSCSGGGSVSCTGSSSCIVGSNYVECDGQRTYCPPTSTCSASYECPVPPYSQPFYISCSGDAAQGCSSNPFTHSVTCGSTTKTCDACQENYDDPDPFARPGEICMY